MRDELDNTTELLQLLESGGITQVLTAADPADEDPFLLGPALVEQLKKKRQIMRKHWLDAESHLATQNDTFVNLHEMTRALRSSCSTSARWLIEKPDGVQRPVPQSTCRVTRKGVRAAASVGRSRERSML